MASQSAYPAYKGAIKDSNLFKPLKVGNLELQNRLVLAPLTRVRAVGHIPSEQHPIYYKQRAQSPGTLLVTEATFIAPEAGGYGSAPGVWSDEQAAKWKLVYDAVHSQKSYIFTQLWALGRNAPTDGFKAENIEIVSASDVPLGGAPTPRALTIDEIKQYVSWYAEAAKRAVDAGSDGVEIHGANGYLPDQFLHESTNKRTDQYGGSVENRARFTLEIIDAVIAAVGAEKVAIRFSPWGHFGEVDTGDYTVPQWSYLAEQLEKRAQDGKRIAYIHVVEPRVDGVTDIDDITEDLNSFFFEKWQGPVIRAGNMVPVIHDAANQNDRTLVASGKWFISNPDLVEKLKNEQKLTQYDRSSFYWDHQSDPAKGYTDYPSGVVEA